MGLTRAFLALSRSVGWGERQTAGTTLTSPQPVGCGVLPWCPTPCLPSSILPVPHAVGQDHWNLAAVSAMYVEHWFGN